jgi:hypothetical protein
MHSLLGLLDAGGPDAVHGALRVMTDFVKDDLTEDQLLPIAKEMLPKLLAILGAADVGYSGSPAMA